uniref:Serine and arginine rich splicing factor 6a n=1 Tax=Cyprinus carpio TaxID=7962 RepID=A0A8C1UHJ3_CYPCA
MPRVYIGRLSYHVREKDIQRFFGGYGKLLEVDLKNGYGFVEFEDTRDADDAVYELNGKELCGERVMVEHARGPRRDRDSYGGGGGGGGRSGYSSRSRPGRDKYGPPVRTEYRLIVENLSSRCSWQDLKDFMRQAGEVTYADAHKERANEGVIEFRSYSDMRRAVEKLDGTDINGRKIRLVEDKQRRRRSYSGSRSRSRSRRHRSRSRSGHRSRSKSPSSKSRSRNRKSRSRSRTHKSRSRSTSRKSRSRSDERKSRSKSTSKVKSDRGRSKEKSISKKSRSRSASPMENGDGGRAKSASRSPSPQAEKSQCKSPDRHSRSRSKSGSRSKSRSRSRSRSVSQD